MRTAPPRVVVAAVGNEHRRDDGAGPAILALVQRRLDSASVFGPLASPLDLLGVWDRAALAVVVDALAADGRPGTVRVIALGSDEPENRAPSVTPRASSHGIGVVEVLRVSRVLGTAPERVVLVGVAGQDFGRGVGLSQPVAQALTQAADLVVETVRGTTGTRGLQDERTHCR